MWRVWKFLTTLACGFKIHEALNNFAHHLWLFVAQQYGEKHKKILSTLHLNSLQMTRWYFSFLLYIASIVCKNFFYRRTKGAMQSWRFPSSFSSYFGIRVGASLSLEGFFKHKRHNGVTSTIFTCTLDIAKIKIYNSLCCS